MEYSIYPQTHKERNVQGDGMEAYDLSGCLVGYALL
jgi:hypothetical protein